MRFLVNTDGGSRGNPGPAGYGYVVRDEDGRIVHEKAGFLGTATNNVAEYMAVVDALRTIGSAAPDAQVVVRADSKLVVQQLSGAWKIKNSELQSLALEARRALPPAQVQYVWVPRAENAEADRLANLAMDERRDVARGTFGADTAHGLGPSDAQPAAGQTDQGRQAVGEKPASRAEAPPSAITVLVAVGTTEVKGAGEILTALVSPAAAEVSAMWVGPGAAPRATGTSLASEMSIEAEPLGERVEDVVDAAARTGGTVVVVVQTELARRILARALDLAPERVSLGASTVSVLRSHDDRVDVVALGVPTGLAQSDEPDLRLF